MQEFNPDNTTIVFSHGFGIQKDNLGLFTFLSGKFHELGYETVLFDYYKYDDKSKEVYTMPFSEQAVKLQNVLDRIKIENPNKQIIILAHSQGCIVPTLCDVTGVSNVIAVSPFFITNKEEIYQRYSAREGSETNFNGVSRRKHSNGQVTVIYPEYWEERFNTDQYSLYNNLARNTKLTLIYGTNDKLVNSVDLEKFTNSKIIQTDSDHDFTGENRDKLWGIISDET